MPLDATTGAIIVGAATLLFLTLTHSLASRHGSKVGFEKGYDEGYHDRQHWETDQFIATKLKA